MMDLEKHIKKLLLTNDCVIIPGLGGFTANYVAARYDERECAFIPPHRVLSFNAKLSINDSLLVQEYAEAYDISYPEALSKIESETDDIKKALDEVGYCELCGIGTLCVNKQNTMEFVPSVGGLLTPNFYALAPFEMLPLSTVDVQEKPSTNVQAVPTAKITLPTAEVNSVLALNKDGNEEKNKNANSLNTREQHNTVFTRWTLLRNVAAILIAVVCFFALAFPVGNSVKTVQLSNIDNGVFANLIVNGFSKISAKPISLEVNNAKQCSNKSAREISNENLTADAMDKKTLLKATVANANSYYSIVLASRVMKTNAEEYVETLKKKGWKEVYMATSTDKLTKVLYGNYSTKSQAQEKLNELRAISIFKDAWVTKMN